MIALLMIMFFVGMVLFGFWAIGFFLWLFFWPHPPIEKK